MTAHDKQKCLDAGCTSYLTKPIVPDTLVQEVLKHLPARAGHRTDSNPVTPPQPPTTPSPATAPTGLLDSGRFADLVNDYLAGLVKTRHEILAHLMTAEFEPLRVLAHKLKGSGSSYGFPQITQAPAQCESLIKSGQSPEKITDAGRALIQQIDIALALR
jgi:DNA-binding response OmpR family regulator